MPAARNCRSPDFSSTLMRGSSLSRAARMSTGWLGTAVMLPDERGENEAAAARVGTVMQTWDAIATRRNVRSFADRPIAAADLDRILEAGRRSPSSQNWQPWGFILVTDREQLGKDELGEYLGALSAASMRGVNQALGIALALT